MLRMRNTSTCCPDEFRRRTHACAHCLGEEPESKHENYKWNRYCKYTHW